MPGLRRPPRSLSRFSLSQRLNILAANKGAKRQGALPVVMERQGVGWAEVHEPYMSGSKIGNQTCLGSYGGAGRA